MAKHRITVELDDEVLRQLEVLGDPAEVLTRFASSLAKGARTDGTSRRERTDRSLSTERKTTDLALNKEATVAVKAADAVLQVERRRADELVKATREEADRTRDPHQSSEETSSTREQERASADALVERERSQADVLLEQHRAREQVAPGAPLSVHRKTTDRDLVGEREQSDALSVDQREANTEMVKAILHARQLETEATAARERAEIDKEQLRVFASKLAAETELRERFVVTLSHDLRTPLAAAKMGAQLVARRSADSAEVVKLAAKVAHNVDRVDEMIRDLLDANAIGAGGTLIVHREPCNLNELTADTLDELSLVHGDRFELRADGQIDGAWSKSGVRRILENLCSNAIKYGEAGRPITVGLSQSQGNARIAIHNEGRPISAEDQATLFGLYRRTESARAGGQKGWGLGLTLVKGIARAHGGDVGVESAEGQGTTFIVTLPLVAPVEVQQ